MEVANVNSACTDFFLIQKLVDVGKQCWGLCVVRFERQREIETKSFPNYRHKCHPVTAHLWEG